MWQHRSLSQPRGEVRNHRTRGSAWSPPEQGGRVQSHGARDSTRALPCREVVVQSLGARGSPGAHLG
jgi:hypothetical protein